MDGSENSPSGIKTFLDNLNIPKLVAGPAGQAISQLIGAGADIPTAKLQQYSQAIRDKTAAKSKVASALADAVSARLATDTDLVDRATQSLLAKEYRRQDNKERIAAKAINYLNDSTDKSEPATAVDGDWLNVFERYAEDASTERLQDIWARVLSGEIRNPNSFSLKTLHFVSELDTRIASTFERYAAKVIDGSFLPLIDGTIDSAVLADLLQLHEYGLVSDYNVAVEHTITLDGRRVLINYFDHGICLDRGDLSSSGPLTFGIPGTTLTQVGREMYSILRPSFDVDVAKSLIASLTKDGLSSIAIGPTTKTAHGSGFTPAMVVWIQSQRLQSTTPQ